LKTLILAILMALAVPAFADDTTVVPTGSTPGSVWDSYGTSPVERGNWVNLFHLDQGVVVGHVGQVWEVTPYIAYNLTSDSKGYPWDNKAKIEGGVKLVKHYDSGLIDFGVAYGFERQGSSIFPIPSTTNGLTIFTDGWFGYKAFNRDNTPGSVWWSLGNSGFDSNIVGLGRVDQGYNFYQNDDKAFGVAGWGQVGFDTQGQPWNNREKIGAGLRGSLSGKHGSAVLTVGYECFGGQSIGGGCGPAVNVDLWDGWNKIGGK
jgi:hypothetical protein